MAVSDETSNDRGWIYSGWKRGKPTDECVWTEHGEGRVHRTDHVVADDKRSNVKPSNSMSYQALLRRNQYLEKRNKRNDSYFKVLFANAGLDVPEDLEDDFMEDTDHVNATKVHLSCQSTENGGTPLTPSSHAEEQIGTPPSGQHDVDHRAQEDSPISDG